MPPTWPHSTDYIEAVQAPAVNFADPDLRAAEVVTNAMGLPQPCSGNFADVYQFRTSDGRRSWAVKCFTRPVSKLSERYREISQHLEQAKLPFSVEFKYLEQGVRIRGQWYPVVKMDWVEGQTLAQWVRQNVGKPRRIETLLGIWLKIEPRLRQAQAAHGDLQHGNVMLVPGTTENSLALKLIDYDGMWVPSLGGQSSGEVGHPSYQHPQRARKNLYTSDVDRFPHFVIAFALRCLARPDAERLWTTYDSGENLLFTRDDFVTPAKSELLHELWDTGDRELQAWVGHLVIASQAPVESTPLLPEIMVNGEMSPLPASRETIVRQLMGLMQTSVTVTVPVSSITGNAAVSSSPSEATPAAPPELRFWNGIGYHSANLWQILKSAAPAELKFTSRQSLVLAVTAVACFALGWFSRSMLSHQSEGPLGVTTPGENGGDVLPAEMDGLPREFVNTVGMRFALIPAGEFQMGSPGSDPKTMSDETPRHRVKISRSFYLGRYEVTQEQYDAITKDRSVSTNLQPNHPVVNISWDEGAMFCRQLSDLEKKDYRLQTEAEWEYACRAGSNSPWYFGDEPNQIAEYAWYRNNSNRGPHAVGLLKPNAFALYDMYGNVSEWCHDWYDGTHYQQSSPIDPSGPASPSPGRSKIRRGGSWDDLAFDCRNAFRQASSLDSQSPRTGIRVLLQTEDPRPILSQEGGP
ncbi:MAG: SUMF1/EgtB/PvdO family nonheme iron enzyme [Planctomycetales bacterium]|nr:SUMF1/EgtB/PvdO family nonheme iron enzyme [Planctomycetales bacterium]